MDPSPDIRVLVARLAHRLECLDRDQLDRALLVFADDPDMSLEEALKDAPHWEAVYAAPLTQLARLQSQRKDETIYGEPADAATDSDATLGPATVADRWSTMYQGGDDAEGEDDTEPTRKTNRAQRFRKLREHAQGGLGKVFVALDDELNRRVALKQILERFAHQNESRDRFVLEAEVTGSLEHPGVVPVYGVGAYEGGEPYYAMRFIEGESMEQAIKEFHQHYPADTDDPSERAFQLRKLVTRLVAVCQAIAYAHSRGVIHRDIKPENIMLGRFGETLVVDWGLAYFIDVADSPNEQSIAGQLTVGNSGNEQGRVVGTPAFMSPEQAKGEPLDAGADVYALGATLFAILTNSTAVSTTTDEGDSRPLSDVLRAAQQGEVRSVELLAPEVPRPLAAICNRALASDKQARYESPAKLADDLERWLSDEPVAAYRENLWERTRRWARRHQTLSTSVAAVVLVSVLGLSAFSAVLGDKNAKLLSLAGSLQTKNQQLDRTIEDLQIAQARATREAQTATAVTEFLNEDLLAQASPLDAPNPRLEVREVLNRAAGSFDEEFADQPQVKARLLKTIGVSYNYLGEYDRSQSALEQSLAIQRQQSDADQRELLSTQAALGALWGTRGRYDEAIRLLRETLAAQYEAFGEDDTDALDTQTELADLLIWAGQVEEARALIDAALERSQKLRGKNHADTLYCEAVRLNSMLHGMRLGEAQDYATDLERRAAEALGEYSYVTLEVRLLHAQLWLSLQDDTKASQLFRETLDMSRRMLGDEHPSTLAIRGEIAMIEAESGDVLKGLQENQVLHKKCLELYGPDHRETIVSATYLAAALFELDRIAEAKQLLESALDRGEKVLGASHPENHYCRVHLARVLAEEQDFDGAMATLKPVLLRRDELRFGPAFQALMCSAEIDAERGEYDAAIATLLELREKVRRLDGSEQNWGFDTDSMLLQAYVAAGSYEQADALLAAMLNRPGLPRTKQMLARTTLADAYWQSDESERAEALVAELQKWAASTRDPQREELFVMYDFAHLVYYLGDPDEAIALYARVIEGQLQQLGPRHFETMNSMSDLAYLFGDLGQHDKSESLYRLVAQGQEEIFGVVHEYTLITLEDLANALLEQDKHRELIPVLLKLREGKSGLMLDDDVVMVDQFLGDSYRMLKRWDEAIAAYQKSLDGSEATEETDDVASLEVIAFMADCYSQQQEHQQAAPLFRRVVRGCRRLYGDNSDATLRALSNWATCLTRLPDRDAARSALTELAAQVETRRMEAEEVLFAAIALANCHASMEQYTDAVRWQRRVLEARRRVLGETALATLSVQQDLGKTLTLMGDEDEAVKVFAELTSHREKVHGPDHASTHAAKLGWATATLHLEDLEQSAKLATDVLESISASKGEDSVDTILPRTALATALMHQGEFPQAILQIRECLEIAYRLLPEDRYDDKVNESVAVLLALLAYCEARDERFEDAWSHVNEAQELIQKTSLQYDWVEALGKLSLGVVHVGREEHASAATQLQAAYEELSKASRISPTALKWHQRQAALELAKVFALQDRNEEAQEWRQRAEALRIEGKTTS